MKLNLKAVEDRVAPLARRDSYDREFIFDLLLAYGKPQGNVTRLRKGSLNVADDPETEVAQKNVVYFKETTGDPLAVIDELKSSPAVVRYNTRFVIVTDYSELLAIDTKTGENLMIPIRDIDQHFTFFLPWAGMEKAQYVAEAHADVKAAERMGKLFDELVGANPDVLRIPNGRHALNVFFTRLLFCFFAEDTGIFDDNQFTNAVASHTQDDGSDVTEFLTDLFTALDTADAAAKPRYLARFPYVNGRLFSVTPNQVVPQFTKKARDLLIELGSLIWREINPDIFGSMFQAIVTPGKRSDLGQHYTSVPNILKTIEPLFLDGLKDQFDAGFDSVKRLEALLARISAIKVFDPACGSGNFLVIAYKELRKLEHAILERLAELDTKHQVLFSESQISIESFYGIEIDDFAVEVAILSLWIAKHQMNAEFKDKFNVDIPLIPLRQVGQIQAGNAARIPWHETCPNNGVDEIYLIGNPPYYGSTRQTLEQKNDFKFAYGDQPFSKDLNYVSLWFYMGARYIAGSRAKLAFLATSSVSQGKHVGLMFPAIFGTGVEIGYAYRPFRWANNSRRNANVAVSVISLRVVSGESKYIFSEDIRMLANQINGYLVDAPNIFIPTRQSPLSPALPPISNGSMPNDGGWLLLTAEERAEMIQADARSEPYVKPFTGTDEFIDGIDKYTLWITSDAVDDALNIPPVKVRVEGVRRHRLKSSRSATNRLAEVPWRFAELRYRPTEAIVVPRHSSGDRAYIPFGYIDAGVIIGDSAGAIYDAEPWAFALLTSRMHMAWVGTVGGRINFDYRYSNTIAYNNFPVPEFSNSFQERMNQAAMRVLDVREYHCDRTLAELYASNCQYLWIGVFQATSVSVC
ncbi:MAG: DNA methyltransferase [Gordonia amarae]